MSGLWLIFIKMKIISSQIESNDDTTPTNQLTNYIYDHPVNLDEYIWIVFVFITNIFKTNNSRYRAWNSLELLRTSNYLFQIDTTVNILLVV